MIYLLLTTGTKSHIADERGEPLCGSPVQVKGTISSNAIPRSYLCKTCAKKDPETASQLDR